MKKLSVFIGLHLWTIFLFVTVSAQDFKTVRDGIEYSEMTREIDSAPVKMNLLRLDLSKVRLDVVHAMDAAIGLEKTSSIAARHGALAAINGGFFRIDKSIFEGDDVGILKIDGSVQSESNNNRTTLFIKNDSSQTEVEIEHFTNENLIQIKKEKIKISGINRERKDNEIIVFNPVFHRTTLTDSDGVEIIVENGKITQILEGLGSSVIPKDGFVISANGKGREEILRYAKIGLRVKKLESTKIPTAQENRVPFIPNKDILVAYALSEDIVSGVPQLIKNDKIEITWQEEKSSEEFVETKHPRTAVAKLKDGKFLMVTVDGRSEASGGIGLEDLAKILLELGATDAMNLDGGGSTTMFLDGKVVNHPSDKEGERKVGDAILVTPRK